jgi:hypothetical protein
MAERIHLTQRLSLAAAAAGRVYFTPPDATQTWRLKAVSIVPNATSAANDTNYATLTHVVGSSTSVAASRATTVAGGALTQGTAENVTLTGTQLQLEITQANAYSVRVAHAASGVAVDVSVTAEFEVL